MWSGQPAPPMARDKNRKSRQHPQPWPGGNPVGCQPHWKSLWNGERVRFLCI